MLRLFFLAAGLIAALLAAELLLRVFDPDYLKRAAVEVAHPPNEALHPAMGIFALDDELGFLPVLGGGEYDALGFRNNSHALAKSAGVTRVVLLGDSAAKRKNISGAFREAFEDEHREVWNAAVEAYNTFQERRYYERFASRASADEVVLFFHLGDFEVAPLCWLDRCGWLIAVHPMRPAADFCAPLLKWSWLYRAWLAWRWGPVDVEPIERDVRTQLAALRDRVAADGARFSVVILPIMVEPSYWPDAVRDRGARALRVCAELGLRCFDLTQPLVAAAEAHVAPLQDPPGDPLHPSRALADRFIVYLREQHLLDAPR